MYACMLELMYVCSLCMLLSILTSLYYGADDRGFTVIGKEDLNYLHSVCVLIYVICITPTQIHTFSKFSKYDGYNQTKMKIQRSTETTFIFCC